MSGTVPDGASLELRPKALTYMELDLAADAIRRKWGDIRLSAFRDSMSPADFDALIAAGEEFQRALAAFRMYYEAPSEPPP